MTGDGVNDALAVKLADIGIAMDSAASATKSVAQLVLLFPFAAVHRFYALELPTDVLGATMLIGFAGIAVLILTAVLLRRREHGAAAVSHFRTPWGSPEADAMPRASTARPNRAARGAE